MLQLFYSNHYEALGAALLDDLAAAPAPLWQEESIIVPSAALRRRLELDIAARFGIGANLRFGYLAQWLWAQIGRVIPVAEQSPFAPERLAWRCYRLLDDAAGAGAGGRLATYLAAADEPMRYELARRVAGVLDHYLTYRPEWLAAWQAGASIFLPDAASAEASSAVPAVPMIGPRLAGASPAQREDERWQAHLWRRLLEELAGAAGQASPADATPPAYQFLAAARQLDLDRVARAAWPARVSVFALPTMPPLHVALLRELAHWIDVRLYVLNPCREFWFDIVTEARAEQLDAAERRDYQEVGNPLLAEWGRQTQAQLHMLQELTEGAAAGDATRYIHNAAPTWLAALQNAVLDLQRLPEPPAPLAGRLEPGIEVHVCHSLARQLEVLHDRLLALFAALPDLEPADVLVALPDLAGAAPLIDAVFGTAPSGDARRIPYRITGLPPSRANPVARALLDLLGLSERSVGASELIEWLRVDAIAARFGIDPNALETVQEWLAAAGARRGLAPDVGAGVGGDVNSIAADTAAAADTAWPARDVPPARHTFADALTRLFLGYAMPDGAEPVGDWLPVAGATGSQAELLGRLAGFAEALDSCAQACRGARLPAAWHVLLREMLGRFFDAGSEFADSITEVRDALDNLLTAMTEGAPHTPMPAAVLRAALTESLDDPARGGVPWGGVTFSALTSLRGLPFRVICLFGMDDGVLPSMTRADEFDLIAGFGKLGDRQRRDDERNLFLDLILAARERLLIGYTGRSIRDNAPLPPAAMVDELLDYLAQAVAGADAAPAQVDAARATFIIEHPLQAFAQAYFAPHGPLFTYDADRADIAAALAAGEASETRAAAAPFFREPLPREAADEVEFDDFERFWRQPIRALLRDRLNIALYDAPAELLDTEPFELDYAGRDALAARLLPTLLEGAAAPSAGGAGDVSRLQQRAARIARASPELPGGATGAVWRERELGALEYLSREVRQALAEGASRLPFTIDLGPQWQAARASLMSAFEADPDLQAQLQAAAPFALGGVLRDLTPHGQLIYRYTALPTARDYLGAWLRHLVWCAATPSGPGRTLWLGSGARFEFAPVSEARAHLAALALLYRSGRCLPLRFFPKSAWAKMTLGETAAQNAWKNEREQLRSESDDAALRIALRGTELALDASFAQLARAVFEPLLAHLVDPDQAEEAGDD